MPDDIIFLDFFSGSGTSADAVHQMNLDGGSRKFIMVQWQEKCKHNTEGYSTIDQIGIRRIIEKETQLRIEHPNTNIDLGFKNYILQEPNQNTLDKLENFVPEEQGLFLTNDILTDFGTQTVLTTWLVRDGYGFNADVKVVNFEGYKGYYVDKHLYLIEPDISTEAIISIVDKYETDRRFNAENVVLFGYSFVWTKIEELKMNLARLKDTDRKLRINFDIRY